MTATRLYRCAACRYVIPADDIVRTVTLTGGVQHWHTAHAPDPVEAPPLFDPDALPVDDDSITAAFEAFHAAHPEVFAQLRSMAVALVEGGWRHLGISMLWETLRYRTMLGSSPDDEPFRLNNNYRSRYARLLMESDDRLADVFETRSLRAKV